jgi:hypothetical protein
MAFLMDGEGRVKNGARSRSFLFAAALSLALAAPLVVPSVAWAAPSAADRETARSLLQDGDRRSESKDYSAALQKYEAAHAIMGFPSTGYAVAKTRAALGLLVEARDLALEVTRMPPKAGEPPAFAKARESAGKLAEDLSRRVPNLEITLKGGPESGDVQLTLDGEAVPAATLGSPRKTNPGHHTVTAAAAGFKSATAEVDLAEGESKPVALELSPDGAGAVAVAPPKGNGAGDLPDNPPDQPEKRHLSPLVYVGFGVGAAGLVTGTVTGILHLTKTSQVKDRYCNGGDVCQPGFESDRDTAKTYATIANIAFGVGIVGVAVGVVALVTSKPHTEASPTPSAKLPPRPRITPQIGLGSVGVTGTF